MSDLEERQLWRKALEESPAVVRWLDTLLRRDGFNTYLIPKFTHTYSSVPLCLSAFGCGSVTISIPRFKDSLEFQVMGMSLLAVGIENSDLDSLMSSIVSIRNSFHNIIYEHPAAVLLVSSLDPPFKPGWLVNFKIPVQSHFQIDFSNPLLKLITYRVVIHGSFEEAKNPPEDS